MENYASSQKPFFRWYSWLLCYRWYSWFQSIAGYCVNSTESSDYSLKKNTTKSFFKIVSFFFRRGVIKVAERNTRDYTYLTVIVK